MKKLGNKLVATFLAAATVVTFIPGVGTQTVKAQSGDPAMNLGPKVLVQNMNTPAAETVYYGRNPWRVIGYDCKGAASRGGAATLLADDSFGQTAYGNQSGDYADSILKRKVDVVAGTLTDGEHGAVIKRKLEYGVYSGHETDCIAGTRVVSNTVMWPLSIREANQVNKDLRINDEDGDRQSDYWWLRSPGHENEYTAFVNHYGRVENMGYFKNPTYGVRPAFYLNLDSVLFTSAAENGKVSGTGGNPLKAQADQTNNGNGWKVTVKDRAHSCFAVCNASMTESEIYSQAITVTYNGAVPGRREYISAIITDKPITDPSAKITYYGRIIRCTLPSGTFTFNAGGKLQKGDNLYLFNEQYNGDNMTDYASGLKKVTVE